MSSTIYKKLREVLNARSRFERFPVPAIFEFGTVFFPMYRGTRDANIDTYTLANGRTLERSRPTLDQAKELLEKECAGISDDNKGIFWVAIQKDYRIVGQEPPEDWKPRKTSLEDELKCGYIAKDALELVEKLPPDQVKRLAAMALTCFESSWSDRLRDLLRGVACLLGRQANNKDAR